jgi:hypothetical protein
VKIVETTVLTQLWQQSPQQEAVAVVEQRKVLELLAVQVVVLSMEKTAQQVQQVKVLQVVVVKAAVLIAQAVAVEQVP